MQEWYEGFRSARGMARPDGRHLYAYRLTRFEYDQLREALGTAVARGHRLVDFDTLEAACLVLFMSEWWRRCYEAGPWNYADALDDIGAVAPPHATIVDLIETGLRFWRREVVDGPRRFLNSLVCEGGLPLQLVKRERVHLRGYLRAVMAEMAAVADPARRVVTALVAAERHGGVLPQGLQHDQVYSLVRLLVLEAWSLQQRLPDGERDPVSWLDKNEPGWRDRLPVDVDDDTAMALIGQTILDAREARLRGADQLGFEVELVRLDEVSFAVQRFLPVGMCAADAVATAFGLGSRRPHTLVLLAHLDERPPVQIALATRVGDGERYRIEPARRAPEKIPGLGVLRLGATTEGRSLAPVLVPGSNLTELPVVFEWEEGSPTQPLIGVGRTKTRKGPVAVLYAPGRFKPTPPLETVGLLDERAMEVGRLTGTTVFSFDEDANCTIVAGADQDDAEPDMTLHGRVSPWQSRLPTFIGLPEFYTGGRNQRPIETRKLVWKPASARTGWQPLTRTCLGEVVVRRLEGHEVRNETRLCVLPEDFALTVKPGATASEGHLACRAAVVLDVAPAIMERSDPTSASTSGGAIRLPDGASLELGVRVRLGGLTETTLAVGFPAKGTRFVDHRGRRVSAGVSLSLEDALSLRAEAFGFTQRQRVSVVARVKAHDLQIATRKAWFDLHDEGDRSVLHLRAIQTGLEDLLSLSRNLDAMLELDLDVLGERPRMGEAITVRRYDRVLSPKADRKTLVLSASDSSLAARSTAPMQAEARHLGVLDAPLTLPQAGVVAGEWNFDPSGFARGPWLITVRQGTRNIARPLLMTVHEDESTIPMPRTESALVAAMAVPDPIRRAAAIKAALEQMVVMPDTDDDVMRACLSTLESLPLETLDVVAILRTVPRLVIRALLNGDSARSLWTRLPGQQFLWECVPLQVWEDEVRRFSKEYRAAFQSDPARCSRLMREAGAPLRELLEESGEVMAAHRALLSEECPESFPAPPSPALLEVARKNRAILLGRLEEPWQEASERHQGRAWLVIRDDDGHEKPPEWLLDPTALRQGDPSLWRCLKIPEGCGFRRPLAYAPLLAAMLAVGNSEPPALAIDWLKRLKRFDPRWFDEAYPFFLALCCAHAGR